MTHIQKILIANRGEIALRIQRACHELGIATVAVYSDVDRGAPHVMAADEAHRLGPAPASESYLRGDLILEVARKSGADAIHPGYGFLSENPDFAEACEKANVKFIGPSSQAMRALGSKTRARQAADAANLPRVPGSTKGLSSLHEALAVANAIDYPVMLKAAAGGGGKGMRPVFSPSEMESAYRTAQSEAERAFGSSEVYLEKLIQRPRHIEIQILGDEFGNCIYLGERECSVQRRHQKVIEEAPSPVVSPALRSAMGEAAVRLAQGAGYSNAGTVEFLVDEKSNFYFLEMNTRLQVEHPVTELVTGLDLVHLQIRVAQGETLPIAQKDIRISGHAIECRIYAEDPANGFFPSPGKINRLLHPSGPGVREDCGVFEGWTVPIEYDPLLSKLITYGSTREAAIARMQRALDEYVIGGIRTNLQLFRRILADPDFRSARIDTGYLERLISIPENLGAGSRGGLGSEDIAALAAGLFEKFRTATESADTRAGTANGWKLLARREGLRS